MFRAGTLSRLKRPSLFRSCRWEASPKAQGFSEDASHHARKHKTPTEGTAYGVHRSVPENQRFRHPVFFVFQLKICRPSTEKVFGSPPFSKGGAGLQGGKPCKERGAGRGALRKMSEKRQRPAPIDRCPKINGSGIPNSLSFS